MFLEADDPNFQTVINRLENKGFDPTIKIIKLNDVRALRKRAGQKIKESVTLGFKDDKCDALVLDSSHIIGVKRIEMFVLDQRKRSAKRKILREERKLKNGDDLRRRFHINVR